MYGDTKGMSLGGAAGGGAVLAATGSPLGWYIALALLLFTAGLLLLRAGRQRANHHG